MRARLLSMAVAGLVLSGCGLAAIAPRAQSPETRLTAQTHRGIEQQVSKERLAAHLSVLTGKTPMPGGTLIPERGTVDGRARTRQYLVSALEQLGYTVERHAYRTNGENLFVRLMAPTPTNEYILLGAHLDSVRNAGANDNGTGTCAVLEAAALLKQLEGRKVNILFAWFDEEELGLIGSVAMAKDFKRQGMAITSAHTIDMMGWDKDGDRAVEIERPDGGLWDYYRMVNETHGLNLPLTRTNSGSTDHVAFREAGFESVGLCEEWVGGDTTPHYHKRTDTYETIDFDYLASTTRLMVAAVGDLSRKVPAPAPSRRLPHDMFPGRDRHFHQH
ncbi:M28 family peptidase [bacterium]|nr:M28 family peptidase [bacterium]